MSNQKPFPISVTADKTISHSGRQTWGTCPRKFQLSKSKTFYKREIRSTKALSFGKAFGTGIQSLLAGDSPEIALLKSALDFNPSLAFDKDSINTQESLAHCHEAILSFYHGQLSYMSADWEVLNTNGLYGVELGFAIAYDNGTVERGFIDCVLQNKHTKEVVVLEVKTSGAMAVGTEADWQNSPQGIMYLIILGYLLRESGLTLNSRVLYIEYNKKHKKYTIFPFEKSVKEKVDFLNSCYIDVVSRAFQFEQKLPLFKTGRCKTYNQQCDFFGVCELTFPMEYAEVQLEPSLHNIHFTDLLDYAINS